MKKKKKKKGSGWKIFKAKEKSRADGAKLLWDRLPTRPQNQKRQTRIPSPSTTHAFPPSGAAGLLVIFQDGSTHQVCCVCGCGPSPVTGQFLLCLGRCFGSLLTVSYIQAPPKEPEIINIDEDEDEDMDEEEEMYDDEEVLEEEEEEVDEDEEMEDTMNDVNGDAASETTSPFPALEPSLKSVADFSGRPQGLFQFY